jgi:hypothetical protein
MKNKENNATAYSSLNGEIVFIENMIKLGLNGGRGYKCLGCGGAQRAVKNKGNWQNYFAHIGANSGGGGCGSAGETYIHDFAKKYIYKEKRIKLPTLWKWSPDKTRKAKIRVFNKKTFPYLGLRVEKGVICGKKSSVETYLFLKEGKLSWSQEHPGDNYNSTLIKADVVFYNKNGFPSLLIEVYVTHKIDFEKRVKLSLLGVDTIEIKIPRLSEEEVIEQIKKDSTKTTWVFNKEQQNTNYESIRSRGKSSNSECEATHEEFSPRRYCQYQIEWAIQQLEQLLQSGYVNNRRAELERRIEKIRKHQEGAYTDQETWKRNFERRLERLQALKLSRSNDIEEEIERKIRLYKMRLPEYISAIKKRHSSLEARYRAKAAEINREQAEIKQRRISLEARYTAKAAKINRGWEAINREQEAINREQEEIIRIQKTPTQQRIMLNKKRPFDGPAAERPLPF